MLSTLKNPDVSSIRLFFSPFFWSLFSCQAYRKAHRMKLLSNGGFEEWTLQTRKNKHSQNQAFSFVTFWLWRPSSYLSKSFSCFFLDPAYVTQEHLRLGMGGQRGVLAHRSFLQDIETMTEYWSWAADGRGDKAVFVVHLAMARASLSLLQIRGNLAPVGSWGG